MPRRKQRTYNPKQTRAAIIEAGLNLFEVAGYYGTSISAITEKAGITKGGFYHHFSSKEDLLELYHYEYWINYSAAVKQVMQLGGEPNQLLSKLIFVMVDHVDRFRPNVAVWIQERRHLSKDKLQKIRKLRNEMLHGLCDVINQGMASGEFRRDIDPMITSLGIVGMCAWTYQWFKSNGRLSAAELAAQFSKLVLKGIQSKP